MKTYAVSIEIKSTFMKDIYIEAPNAKLAKLALKEIKRQGGLELVCDTFGFSGDYDEQQLQLFTIKEAKEY